jgi:Na+/proline symporter
MIESSSTSRTIKLALAIIAAHAAVVSLHAAAHQILGVEASRVQLLFIVAVIMLAPLIAALLLWKRLTATGATLLAVSMAGALLFGVYNHFVAISPDHVSHVGAMPQKFWALIFQITAALLALVEALGIWAGIRMLKND